MTEGHPEGSRGPRRWRYLIDIIVLLAVTFLLDAALGAFVQVPIDLEKGFVLDAVVKVLLVGVGCGLVLLRVLASGRNLWAVIIGHGLFDASRFVLFYFQGPPT